MFACPTCRHANPPDADACVRCGAFELLAAGIGGDNAREELGQRDRRLSVAGADVERELMCGAQFGEPLEQLTRIGRPVRGVPARDRAEVVGKARSFAHSAPTVAGSGVVRIDERDAAP